MEALELLNQDWSAVFDTSPLLSWSSKDLSALFDAIPLDLLDADGESRQETAEEAYRTEMDFLDSAEDDDDVGAPNLMNTNLMETVFSSMHQDHASDEHGGHQLHSARTPSSKDKRMLQRLWWLASTQCTSEVCFIHPQSLEIVGGNRYLANCFCLLVSYQRSS